MLQESPVIPHTLAEILRLLLATSLGTAGGWLAHRRRESAETNKLNAEARSIDAATYLSLINEAAEALTKANRVIDQCSHWERKAAALQLELDQAGTQERLDGLQIARLNGLVKILASILEENKIKIPDDCRIS